MKPPKIVLAMKEYDWLSPLECGEVSPDGFDLSIDHNDPMNRTANDLSVDGGEFSFGVYLIQIANGDSQFVGLPIFPYRAFRHRCFFTLRDSEIVQIGDLQGKRIGTNAWPTTSSTWNRALLRYHQVDITQSQWWVGPMDDPAIEPPQANSLPSYAKPAPLGRTIEEMLISREVDALMCPRPTRSFYQTDSPIIRIVSDYRSAELEHFMRTKLYTPDHIVVLRRDIFNKHPEIVSKLYFAFEQAKDLWLRHILTLPYSNMTPWGLADIEEISSTIGEDWQPFGIQSNQNMIQALCDETIQQGLVDTTIKSNDVFIDFERAIVDGD